MIKHVGLRSDTRAHARTRGFTRVRVLTLNSMHLTHKRTEEVRMMDKIRRRRNREDPGSGAWTLGHTGSPGDMQVRARGRSDTRTHAGVS